MLENSVKLLIITASSFLIIHFQWWHFKFSTKIYDFLCSCVLLWHVYHKPIRWIHVVNLTNQMFANITMFKTDEIISRIKFDISPKHFQITFLQLISLKLYQFYYSFTIQSLIWYFDFVLTYFFHCHLFS